MSARQRPAVCELDEIGQPSQVLTYGANRAGAFSLGSGSALFVHHAGSAVTLNCGDATAIYAGGQPSTVTLLPLGKVTTGSTAVTGPKHAKGAAHGPTAR